MLEIVDEDEDSNKAPDLWRLSSTIRPKQQLPIISPHTAQHNLGSNHDSPCLAPWLQLNVTIDAIKGLISDLIDIPGSSYPLSSSFLTSLKQVCSPRIDSILRPWKRGPLSRSFPYLSACWLQESMIILLLTCVSFRLATYFFPAPPYETKSNEPWLTWHGDIHQIPPRSWILMPTATALDRIGEMNMGSSA